ncbi:hypothetical protein D9M69_710480 [compost metagenome]
MDLRIRVQLVDQAQQLRLGGTFRHVVVVGGNAYFFGRAALVAYVNGGSGIPAHQHHGQAGARLARGHPRVHPDLQLVEQVFGDAAAVQDSGSHGGGAV